MADRDWDGGKYHRVSEPQFRWGLEVLKRLPLRGDERVMDAGCGSGRLTEVLLERLPNGRVLAVDNSPSMLAKAEELRARHPERLALLLSDLGALPATADCNAVFSAATFHWIPDHDRLFRALFGALKPGGLLVAQCGGQGNLDQIHHRAHGLMDAPAFRPHFATWKEPWNFAGVEQTQARLEAAGFRHIRVWLEQAPTPFPGADDYRAFISTVVLRPFLAALPDEATKAAFLEEVVQQAAPAFTLDYVRLNLDGRKPS